MGERAGLVFDWASWAVDDEESILAEDDGHRAEATAGGYLLVARSWTVSGDASWHVEAGYDETPDLPAGSGGDIPAASLLAAQIAAEAFVLGRLAVDPGVAAAVAVRAAEVEGLRAQMADIEALLGRLGGPGPDRGTLAERVAAVVSWGRLLALGDTAPAVALSYGVDADALAAHDAAAVARARALAAEARVAELEAECKALRAAFDEAREAEGEAKIELARIRTGDARAFPVTLMHGRGHVRVDHALGVQARAEKAAARAARLEAALRWRPLSEPLPPDGETVEIINPRGRPRFFGYFVHGVAHDEGGVAWEHATHWRPLTAGPEAQP